MKNYYIVRFFKSAVKDIKESFTTEKGRKTALENFKNELRKVTTLSGWRDMILYPNIREDGPNVFYNIVLILESLTIVKTIRFLFETGGLYL